MKKQTFEVWKAIQGYEGLYEVSNWGRVKSVERVIARSNGTLLTVKERIMKPQNNGSGHLILMFWKNGKCEHFQVHILVATAFIPNPYNYAIVHHKDYNPRNNRVENLEWISKEEHDAIHGNIKTPKRVDQIDKVTGEVLHQWERVMDVVRNFKYKATNISYCALGKRKLAYDYVWKYPIFI